MKALVLNRYGGLDQVVFADVQRPVPKPDEILVQVHVHRLATKLGVKYSFLLVKPDGCQLAEIGELSEAGSIRLVIHKVFPFDQAKEALAYLANGWAEAKVVVQMKQTIESVTH